MSNNYAINGVGGFSPTDAMFLQYALSAPNANNPAFRGISNQNTQTPQVAQTDSTTNASNTGTTTPSFQGNAEKEEDSNTGTLLLVGSSLVAAGGALWALKRGNAKGLKGFEAFQEGAKDIWNNIFGKSKTNETG